MGGWRWGFHYGGAEDVHSLDLSLVIVVICVWYWVLEARSQDCLRYLLLHELYAAIFGAAVVGGIVGDGLGLAQAFGC
jgi:hypothetical protein